MTSRTFARLAPRRSATVRGWWARAVASAAEESAYDPADLTKGAGLARKGAVGEVRVEPGRVVAAVVEGEEPATVEVTLPVLEDEEAQTLAEVLSSAVGWTAGLLQGEVPPGLDEALEEAGVELLPYGGFEARCTCEAWVDPCPHALALLTQVAWLVDAEPLVLLHLRGLDRAALVDRVASTAVGAGSDAAGPDAGPVDSDLEVALEAAERVATWLEQERWDPSAPALGDGGDDGDEASPAHVEDI